MHQETKTVHPYELRARGAKALLQRLYRDVNELIEEEVDLAKAEVAERRGIVTAAARSFVLASACGLLALACCAAAAIAGLATVMPAWAAALIVGVVFAVVAFALRSTAQRTFAKATEPARSRLGALLTPTASGGTLAEREARVDWTRRQVAQTLAAVEQKSDLLTPMRDTALGLGSLAVTLGAIVRSGNGEHPRSS
jgi:hypothetical protein